MTHFKVGALLAMSGVALGAFGAHGLKNLVDLNALTSFETGVRYQMYHSLGLLLIGLTNSVSELVKKRVLVFFLLGIICFSGSIYLLALNSLIEIDTTVIGIVTPIVGLFFTIGWLYLGYKILKLK